MQISMLLQNVLYVSYLAPEERIRPKVPDVLPLSLVDGQAVVSVVLMKCSNVHLRALLSPRLSYDQINLRTYVKNPGTGEQSVFFFASGVTSATTAFMSHAAGVPWKGISLRIRMTTGAPPQYLATGKWGGEVRLRGQIEEGRGSASPFLDGRSEREFILRPSTGFFRHVTNKTLRLRTRHPEVDPLPARVNEFYFPLLQRMGLLRQEEMLPPQGALFVPEEQFINYLPLEPVD